MRGIYMDFKEYDDAAKVTAVYPNQGNNPIYPTLGLVGEAGEIAEKVKKMLRDDNGILTEERRQALIKELGDVLWYLSALSREIGSSLEEIAKFNIEKLHSRLNRSQIHGDGDNR
jgi:NTP pyrophosphatase (non-canonical NTP hydrolase)